MFFNCEFSNTKKTQNPPNVSKLICAQIKLHVLLYFIPSSHLRRQNRLTVWSRCVGRFKLGIKRGGGVKLEMQVIGEKPRVDSRDMVTGE